MMRISLGLLLLLGLVFTGGCASTSRANVRTEEPADEISAPVKEEVAAPKTEETVAMSQAAVKTEETKAVEEPAVMSNREVQIALKNAGYYAGEVDGVLGSRSREAIRKFQQDNGLIDDSVAGPKTQEKLRKYINTEYKP